MESDYVQLYTAGYKSFITTYTHHFHSPSYKLLHLKLLFQLTEARRLHDKTTENIYFLITINARNTVSFQTMVPEACYLQYPVT